MTMTTAPRIRWEDGTFGGFHGYTGTLAEPGFQIWRPERPGGDWILTSPLPCGRGSGAMWLGSSPGELKGRAEELLAEFAASLGASFPAAPGERPAAIGPFGSEQDARAAAIATAGPPREGWSILSAGQNLVMLTAACEAAGVVLGDYDRRILRWLAGFEDAACAVIAGLIGRAHEAGVLAGRTGAGQ